MIKETKSPKRHLTGQKDQRARVGRPSWSLQVTRQKLGRNQIEQIIMGECVWNRAGVGVAAALDGR